MADQARLRSLDHLRQSFEPSGDRRQPNVERGEFAGEQREEAVAEQIDPVERVPGLLAQLGLGEAGRLQFADQQIPVDRVVAGELGDRPETRPASVR